MLNRLRRAASSMRQRSLARLTARVDQLDAEARDFRATFREQLREIHAGIAATREALERIRREADDGNRRPQPDGRPIVQQAAAQAAGSTQMSGIAASMNEIASTLASVQKRLTAVEFRTEQLRSIAEADAITATLDGRWDGARGRAHLSRAIAKSTLETDPCPHIVVDKLFPGDIYEAVIRGLPPSILFDNRKQELKVPPEFGPVFSSRIWHFVAEELVRDELGKAVIAKFKEPLTAYLQRFWPNLSLDDPDVSLIASDGRILMRRAGYVIPPHRDPRWRFITAVIFLAHRGDPEAWGTQLYRVRRDVEAPGPQPYWIDAAQCELVKDVAFRPNRAVIFMNSEGAHGASIPVDAPPEFERYIYQWRLGPSAATLARLKSQLSPDARASWEGSDEY